MSYPGSGGHKPDASQGGDPPLLAASWSPRTAAGGQLSRRRGPGGRAAVNQLVRRRAPTSWVAQRPRAKNILGAAAASTTAPRRGVAPRGRDKSGGRLSQGASPGWLDLAFRQASPLHCGAGRRGRTRSAPGRRASATRSRPRVARVGDLLVADLHDQVAARREAAGGGALPAAQAGVVGRAAADNGLHERAAVGRQLQLVAPPGSRRLRSRPRGRRASPRRSGAAAGSPPWRCRSGSRSRRRCCERVPLVRSGRSPRSLGRARRSAARPSCRG